MHFIVRGLPEFCMFHDHSRRQDILTLPHSSSHHALTGLSFAPHSMQLTKVTAR
jgi:hypothetical protein